MSDHDDSDGQEFDHTEGMIAFEYDGWDEQLEQMYEQKEEGKE